MTEVGGSRVTMPGRPAFRDRLRVEVLGPIRVVGANGEDLTPAGPLQRRLFALLVLRRDHVVAVADAIDALWPERPPRDATAAMHNQVFRLRRRLPAGTVESVGDGYVVASACLSVDADEVADITHGPDRGPDALSALDTVLERWRGPAYPELADVDSGRIEAARLEELRVRAWEARAECRLAAGETETGVAELARLVDEHPLRERPRALLMTALERAGRRVDALRAYDDFRRLLGDELGIDPSAALTAQHAALLAGTDKPAVPAARLPVPPTSLVGRDALVEDTAATVDTHRLVTLVGPGGVGKTRLAIEVGHRLRAVAADRPVVLCELGTVGEVSAVEHVAGELRIEPRAGLDLVDRIAEVAGTGALVLVLDGCEHVLDRVAVLVDRLVTRCPAVRVLVTSRERLRLPGERVLPVPPLACGDAGDPAVELFVDRARAADPGFDPSPAELETVIEIARRLDGLPLAIELAAARLHTHGLAEVAGGLDERFALLSSGYRTSSRHGSLRTAVSWSYELLDDRLRRTFADLSVFAGSFTVADAAAVCDLHSAVASEHLAQLVERSLANRAPGARFGLLETLRAFGAEQLRDSGRDATVRERHARRLMTFVEDADRRLLAAGPGAIDEVDASIPDLRAALDWLLASGHAGLASRLVVALRHYGFFRPRPDVLAWAARVTDADPDGRDPLAALVWTTRAEAAWLSGDLPGAAACGDRARVLGESAGYLAAGVAELFGTLALFDGRLDDATNWYRRGSEIAAETGDELERLVSAGSEVLARAYAGDRAARSLAAELLVQIGDAVSPHAAYTWYCAGEADLGVDDDRARARHARAVELAELTGASFVVGVARASLASIDARVGDPDAAAEMYRWLIPHWRRAGVWPTQWTMLRSIAVLLDRLGRHREAAVLEGAVRASSSQQRIYGADEIALTDLAARLRVALGDAAYDAARAEGAQYDGDAAADHALRSLW